jgi:hypothetical protein
VDAALLQMSVPKKEKATLISERGLFDFMPATAYLPHTFACSTIGPAGLNLRRFAGVSEAGARSRNPERSFARDLSPADRNAKNGRISRRVAWKLQNGGGCLYNVNESGRRLSMKQLSTFVVCAIFLSLSSIAAPEKIERYVSTELSPDQMGVYSFILKSYRTLLKPTYRDMLAEAFYLEEETRPLDMSDLQRDPGCLHGLDLEALPKERIPTVHRLFSSQRWLPSSVKPAAEAKCQDSPSSKSQICWRTEGTLSLSEIVFDKSHRHALVGFGVHCGMECGWGELVVLEKVDGHWRQKGVCKEWYL